MKIRPMGAELFHVDRQTDGQMDRHDEANSRFSQFCQRASQCVARIDYIYQYTYISASSYVFQINPLAPELFFF